MITYTSEVDPDEGLTDLLAGLEHVRAERSRLHLAAMPQRQQRDALIARIRSVRGSWWRRLFQGRQQPEWTAAANRLTAELAQHQAARDAVGLDLAFDLEGPAQRGWELVQRACRRLSESALAEDVIAQTGVARNAVRELTTRRTSVVPVTIPVISPDCTAWRLGNCNGDDYVFYPGFLVLVGTGDDPVCFVDYADLAVGYAAQEHRVRQGSVRGATVLRVGYEHENRDGSPDKRMRANRCLDVLAVAQLEIRSEIGLDDRWLFSDRDAVRDLVRGVHLLSSNTNGTP